MGARAYTVASLAAAWECSEGVIRKMIAAGQLRSFRIGTLIRIPADEVERYECLTTASNDSEADLPASGRTGTADGIDSGLMRPTGLARRRRRGATGDQGATVHRGPWGGS